MKKLFLFLTILCCISGFAQSEIKITTKKCIPKKGCYLQLKNIFDDSRCPEGTQCIWAGEVSIIINVYKDKKFIEEKTMTFSTKNREENTKWFEGYYSKKIKSIGVAPYPKDGVKVKPKKKYLTIVFID